MFGPIEGKRHEAAVLAESDLLQAMEHTGDYCVYCDPACPNSPELFVPYRGAALTTDQKAFNDSMLPLRLSIECDFGDIVRYFALLDFKKKKNSLKLQPISKYHLVDTIHGNCHACIYGNHAKQDVCPCGNRKLVSWYEYEIHWKT